MRAFVDWVGTTRGVTARRLLVGVAALCVFFANTVSAGEFSAPWADADTAIVLDPFHGNDIDWDKVQTDPRVVGVIHKASQGLASDSKYQERKAAATARHLLWGSYHLLTTANVASQIDRYLQIVGTNAAEVRAVDVECIDTSGSCQSAAFKVSFAQIEEALKLVKTRTGRFPLLYANHSVAKALSARWHNSSEFSDVRLWYARFKKTVSDFPVGPWSSYSIWQFSSEINCTADACPYRVPGTAMDMDLNVYFGSGEQLRSKWPL